MLVNKQDGKEFTKNTNILKNNDKRGLVFIKYKIIAILEILLPNLDIVVCK